VSREQKLVSAMNYDKRRLVHLYLNDCSKDSVEEKDNNEAEVVAHNSMEPNPVNTAPNVDANADDSDSDSEINFGVEANPSFGKKKHKKIVLKKTILI